MKEFRQYHIGILEHPRLVFDTFDLPAESITSYYLDQGKPFTVVIKKENRNGNKS